MQINIKKYPNGLTLIYQQIKEVASAAYTFNFGNGLSQDPQDRQGAGLILAELISRQAGGYSQQELSDMYDSHGISHGESAKLERYQFQGSCLSSKLPQALELLETIFTKPAWNEDSLPKIKELFLQDLLSMEDEPNKIIGREFNSRYFPEPFNRSPLGEAEGIRQATMSDLKQLYQEQFKVSGAVLAIVANLDFEQVEQIVGNLWVNDAGKAPVKISWDKFPPTFSAHRSYDSAQTQIMLAYRAPDIKSPDYYTFRLINGLLSGGMFGRLFLEVREKRGLCYSVYSSYSAQENYGRLVCYSGTTPERAATTLAVIQEVLAGLAGTIAEDELQRVKTDMLSSMIISRESSLAKTIAYVNDYENFGVVRELLEIKNKITNINLVDINQFLERYAFSQPSILTLGKSPI